MEAFIEYVRGDFIKSSSAVVVFSGCFILWGSFKCMFSYSPTTQEYQHKGTLITTGMIGLCCVLLADTMIIASNNMASIASLGNRLTMQKLI